MMTIELLYIDDQPEPALTRYLVKELKSDTVSFNYTELKFEPENGYESLITSSEVRTSNIIIIDSRLFENQTSKAGKFSGEEFKLILKKYFPYIEVIVITQNGENTELDIVPKYNSSGYGGSLDATKHYEQKLKPHIMNAVKNLEIYHALRKQVEDNDTWDNFLKQKVLDTLDGDEVYAELKKEDIDQLVEAFKELQSRFD